MSIVQSIDSPAQTDITLGTYEELMLGVRGKGKGKRGRVSKKGGSKVDIDEVMELGYGEC